MFTQSSIMNRKKVDYQIEIDGIKVPWKEHVRYLGVHFDPKLSFKNHFDISLRKTNGMISTLFSIFKKQSLLPHNLKMLIYKLYLRPIFTYAAPLFANASTTQLKRLQTMQNKCLRMRVRMALNMPRFTRVSDLHGLAKIPTISEFIEKLTDSFYIRSQNVANDFVNSLGTYDLITRVKHRLPIKNSVL